MERLKKLAAGQQYNIDTSKFSEIPDKKASPKRDQNEGSPKQRTLSAAPNLNKENKIAIERFLQQLSLKAYSVSTIRTYTNEFLQFLKLLKHISAESLTINRIRSYFQYCYETKGLSKCKTACFHK